MPCITFGLFRGILDICLDRGITHVSAVMEPALLRLLKRFGLHFAPVGGLIEYHGLRQPCVAPLHDLIHHVRDERRPLWLYASKAMGWCNAPPAKYRDLIVPDVDDGRCSSNQHPLAHIEVQRKKPFG
jgi:hypothetical protein